MQTTGINLHPKAGQRTTPSRGGLEIRMFLISGSSSCQSMNSMYISGLVTFRLKQ